MQQVTIRTITAISLGAVPAALLRYFITTWTEAIFGQSSAYYGTFFINISGCFILALFYTLNERRFRSLPPDYRLAIATGFCGAYTTFSTYMLEVFIHIEYGNTTLALLYGLGSMVAGMVTIKLGVVLGRLLVD